jgi:hypothetical protein
MHSPSHDRSITVRQRLASLAALLVFGVATVGVALADTQVYIVNNDKTSQVKYQIKCGLKGSWSTVMINPQRKQGWNDCPTTYYIQFNDGTRTISYKLLDGTVQTFNWHEDAHIWKLTARPQRDDE